MLALMRRAGHSALVSTSDDGDQVSRPGPANLIPGDRARPRRSTDAEYRQEVERLANEVVSEAYREGWLTYLPDDESQTALQRSINELAKNLRHVHFEGDGCLDHLGEEDHDS